MKTKADERGRRTKEDENGQKRKTNRENQDYDRGRRAKGKHSVRTEESFKVMKSEWKKTAMKIINTVERNE